MSDQSTKRMIETYMEEASAPMFLSGFFRSPPENFHNTEMVELDVQRDGEDVAVVVQDLSAGGRLNESDAYTNKGFIPPIFQEEGAVSAYKLLHRAPGQNPFQDPVAGANALRQAFRIFRKLESKIRRAVELMASQVLQDGVLTLIDDAGVTLYTLDFQMKATHKATASTTWAADGSAGNPLQDLEDLAIVVRRDGKHQPNRLIFGKTAWQRAKRNAAFLAAFDKNVMNIASMQPQLRGQGATFQGWIWIGQYRFEMWTYDGFYKHPQTGTLTPYVHDEKVIMLSENARLDLTFGGIPMLVPPDQRVLPFLPPRISGADRGLDLTTNAWVTPNGQNLMVSAGTRPLTIPTAIDTFASLDITT
jgi:predicted lipoprotein with Yx(FWY)xxD motif